MALISLKCTNCGGDIQMDDKKESGFCVYCGAKVLLQQAVTNINNLSGNVVIDGKVQIIDNRLKLERDKKMERIKRIYEKARTGIYWEAEKNANSYESFYEAEIGVDGGRRMGYGLIEKLCTELIAEDDADAEAYYYRALSNIETSIHYCDIRAFNLQNENSARSIVIQDINNAVKYADSNIKGTYENYLNRAFQIFNEKINAFKNIRSTGSGGSCYIATAVYGSYDAPEVLILRKFRDEILGATLLGRIFISAYYKLSPRFAVKLKRMNRMNRYVKRNLDKFTMRLKTKHYF
ncbi:MAG TPA: hypothetical protein PKH29_03140 [Oscillospiraceae bacterium]|nr:hypothetical protein [Oscillospiraceae bacterium]